VASDNHAGPSGTDRLRTAIERASGAWDHYQEIPERGRVASWYRAWEAVLQPQFAGQLAPVMRARVLFQPRTCTARRKSCTRRPPERRNMPLPVLEEARALLPGGSRGLAGRNATTRDVLRDRFDLTSDADELRQAADLLREVRDHPAETDVVAASVELAACLLALDTTDRAALDDCD